MISFVSVARILVARPADAIIPSAKTPRRAPSFFSAETIDSVASRITSFSLADAAAALHREKRSSYLPRAPS
ncbi:MAG TPA: hypothetical protein DDZ68_12035 [Parvularcula sp.]|nr:hypothetical protein [Parvularcula sp.]HBS34137.1 hypothetical protein [Parvularcula sp.]